MPNEETVTTGQDKTTEPGVNEQQIADVKDPSIPGTEAAKATDPASKNTEGADSAELKDRDGQGKTDDKALADEKEGTGKAPEAYGKFSLPEGFEYDEKLAERFGGVAKDIGLSQEQAQKLVDHYIELTQNSIAAHAAQIESQSEEWRKSAETDKEYGGADFEKNMAFAKAALDDFGSPGLLKCLTDSKLGNHPELIRFCWKVGKALSDDHQPDDTPGKMVDPNKKMSEDEVAKLLFGKQKY